MSSLRKAHSIKCIIHLSSQAHVCEIFSSLFFYLLILNLKMWNKRSFFSPLKKKNCTDLQITLISQLLLFVLSATDLHVTFSHSVVQV